MFVNNGTLVATGSTDPPPEQLFDVSFCMWTGVELTHLREIGVRFSRVIDLMKLYRNHWEGKVPCLPAAEPGYRAPYYMAVGVHRGVKEG